jgi:putative glycerol-1-phosphate prenyltransferase
LRFSIDRWRHVFKLDPDKPIADNDLKRLCQSGTDAVIVGGSTGVTYENSRALLMRLKRFSIPLVQEISDEMAVVPGFDLYLIPFVLNAGSIDWMVRRHQQAVKKFDGLIPWERVIAEGYIILNPEADAARVTGAETELQDEDVVAYAQIADRLLRLPVVYLEYSGRFGDPDLVNRVGEMLTQARLFYGGGVDRADRAAQVAGAADTVIVGNIIYENMEKALETVAAVKP